MTDTPLFLMNSNGPLTEQKIPALRIFHAAVLLIADDQRPYF